MIDVSSGPQAHWLAHTRSLGVWLVASLCACAGGSTTSPVAAPVLTTVTVALSAAAIQTGQTANATASGRDQHGSAIATGSVAWSSTSPSVASVNATTGVITAVAAGQATIIASVSGKQGQATLAVIVPPVSGNFRIVFARGSVCHSDSFVGCDLFGVDVNMTTGAPGAVTTVAAEAGVAEVFPALSSSGRFVIYNRITYGSGGNEIPELYAADLLTKSAPVRLIGAAKFPSLSSDDRKLFFSRDSAGRGDIYVADVTLNTTTGTVTLGVPVKLTSAAMGFATAGDPAAVGTGGGVVFHFNATPTTTAAAGYLAAGSTTVTNIGDASGHLSTNAAGSLIAVSSSIGVSLGLISSAGAGWNAKQNIAVPTTPATFTSDDSRFGSVSLLGWTPGDWLDDAHILANVQGGALSGTTKTFSMSRLFLVTLSTATAEPVAARLGGVAGDYFTVAVRRLP